eukprot:gnl/MRDRNA2_/MRDRNA2_114051_c0_seq1.p1 gnl/MRDRNA2_/MRDRNA2_114051_c0~~gnl/MRDRNA2_/MRDRNA2_114051_c0_seq1.p1  ORF type:complete len:935 (+),score=199.99 gnl/MRDRNA2_/MRDRNA2_114051_c0_seq1:115-2919(+)
MQVRCKPCVCAHTVAMREDMYLSPSTLTSEEALRILLALKVSDAAAVILQALQQQAGLLEALKEIGFNGNESPDILGKVIKPVAAIADVQVEEKSVVPSGISEATALEEIAPSKPADLDKDNGAPQASAEEDGSQRVIPEKVPAIAVKVEQEIVKADPVKAAAPDSGSGANSEPSGIIQFSTGIYYCVEDEGVMTIDVMLLGAEHDECSCSYETIDATAKAGHRYKHTAGHVSFGDGEISKQIQIPILMNESWDSTLEFEIVLTNPVGAKLGRYLSKCRVKVIDDDSFPTNKFQDVLKKGVPEEIEQLPKPLLMMEYFKMNFQNPVIKRGTVKCCLVDHLHNLYFIWRLILMRYLINDVLIEDADPADLPANARLVLIFIMCAIIFPNVGLHILDLKKLMWKVGGTSRKTIQANLLRKFLNYDENSRQYVKEADLIMAMTRDTNDLVGSGYMKMFVLVKGFGKLFVILLYQTVGPLVQGKQPKPVVILPVVVFPIIMLSFLKIRNKKTLRACNEQDAKQNALVAHVDSTVMNYRLIADYNRRPYFVDMYEKRIGQFNATVTQAGLITVNNRKFAPWVSTVIGGVYIVWGGLSVLDGATALGSFIVNLEIFKAIGDSWADIYSVMLDLQNVFPALGHIVTFMNLPTDVKKRMELSRYRRSHGNKQRAEMRAKKKDGKKDDTSSSLAIKEKKSLVDLLEIQMESVTYEYDVAGTLNNSLGKLSFNLPQGSFTTFVGHRGKGKTTLLKILGGVLLPADGIFIPPHLRVLHISEQPLFFEGTMMENLTFGVHPGDEDGRIERVIAVCRKLLIPENIIELIAKDTHTLVWGEVLSLTQRTLLNLARSLIANPEVLCIHKPTLAFDRLTAENTLQQLRCFVDEKGVEQDPTQVHHRRPRTCVITAARAAGVKIADQVYMVDSETGVTLVDKSSVTDEMLS